MEQNKKKQIMIAIIVVCVVLAVGLTLFRGSEKSGIDSIKDSDMTWVKCSNPDCGTEYQVPTKEYFKGIQQRIDPNAAVARTPSLICQKCGKASIYRALKCEKCGKIYFPGVASRQFMDKCSECGYSVMEERVKKAKGG
jgi:predicted RNA-binding Zn-ribbon protein involved in translation (DUF1610 family)